MSDDRNPRRLTRAESKELTRQRLIDAAKQVFARRGYAAASVDEIAEAAGFSVGAVYSNFAGKDELFAALMNDRASGQMAHVAKIVGNPDGLTTDPLKALGAMLIEIADKDIDVAVLETEFWLHAVRNPDLMRTETDRTAQTLSAVRDLLGGVLRDNNIDDSVSLDEFAITTLALFGGLIRQRRTDPTRVTEDTFGQALRWQVAGMPTKSDGK